MKAFVLTAALLLAPALALADDAPGGTRPMVPKNGEEVYRYVCAACHMQDAKGATGAATIPALASNPRLGAAAYPILTIVRGKGAMQAFGGVLTAEQIAGVTGYIRTHFGNNYPAPVTAADVAKLTGP